MLQGKSKKVMMIAILCCMLIFMGVGFAALSSRINVSAGANISGIWDIQITNMKVLSKTGLAEEGSFSYEGVNAEFSHKLYAPGDSIEYEITVTNKGNIKASLKQITSDVSPEYEDLILTNTLYQGQTLEGGASMTFTVKSEFDIKATSLPNETIEPIYNIEIIYYQYAGNEIVTPPDISTDNVCFTISSDGTLGEYDFSCGRDAVVPASINGINVTKISEDSFQATSYLKGNGYIQVEEYSLINNNSGTIDTYYFLENEEAMTKVLGLYSMPDPYYQILSLNDYTHYIIGNVEDAYIYNYWFISGFDLNGEEVYEEPAGILYWLMDNETGEEYLIIPDPSVYDAAVKYIESYGYDESMLYVAGDPDIPYSNYRTKFSDFIKEQNLESSIWYTNGARNSKVSNAAALLTSLDLSKAIYLQTIQDTIFKSLNKLTLPEGSLTTIGKSVFRDSPLQEVIIPSTVTEIGDWAFYSMPSGSVIKINRPNSTGLTLGNNWKGKATIKYIG